MVTVTGWGVVPIYTDFLLKHVSQPSSMVVTSQPSWGVEPSFVPGPEVRSIVLDKQVERGEFMPVMWFFSSPSLSRWGGS